jgi:hypothetical protein
MAGASDEREAPGREWGDERHLPRVSTDDALRDADEDLCPSGRLEHRRGGDDRKNDEEDIDRWRCGNDAEAGREHEQPHRSPQAQADAASACPDPDRRGDDEELEHDADRHAAPPEGRESVLFAVKARSLPGLHRPGVAILCLVPPSQAPAVSAMPTPADDPEPPTDRAGESEPSAEVAPAESPAAAVPAARVAGLDVIRGIALLGILLLEQAVAWSTSYHPLRRRGAAT